MAARILVAVALATAIAAPAAAQLAPAYQYDQPVETYQPPVQDYGYAQESAGSSWFSGNWYLKVGGALLHKPRFEGASGRALSLQPMISIGKAGGKSARFSSRNDNISLGFIDTGTFRAGAAGKLVFRRDGDTDGRLAGLSPVPFGGEAGAFVEIYPAEGFRMRAEVRHGIRSHDGIVADLSADAYMNVTDTIQISAGPRASWASADYFDAYYGVSFSESLDTGNAQYNPGSGIRSAGFGGAVTWKATDRLDTSIFAEYSRLMGPAADSSIVRQGGSRNQLTVGASAVYRLDLF
jgi:MipA family protein